VPPGAEAVARSLCKKGISLGISPGISMVLT
jgi:hypothetical protein